MEIKRNLYERYRTTASLPPGVDEKAGLEWSKSYFSENYSRFLPDDKNANILEVGCGYGRYLSAMSDLGYVNCYGIDLSEEQISYAKSTLRLSNVEEADALIWLEGKESMFDCILALDILEHLEIDGLLRLGEQMNTALKPGGIVIFQVPNSLSPLNPIIHGDLTHVRAFTPQSVKQYCLLTGFTPIGYYEIPPHAHTLQTRLRRVLWRFFLKPVIGLVMRIAHGRVLGGDIYTENFLVVGKK